MAMYQTTVTATGRVIKKPQKR